MVPWVVNRRSRSPSFNHSHYPYSLSPNPYPLSFQSLAHSFAINKCLTPLFSIVSALFAKNHRGGVYRHSFFEDKMKSQNANPVVLIARCTHHTATAAAAVFPFLTRIPAFVVNIAPN